MFDSSHIYVIEITNNNITDLKKFNILCKIYWIQVCGLDYLVNGS